MTAALSLRISICETRVGKPDDLAFVVDCWTKNDPELRSMRLGVSTKHVRALLGVADIAHHELPRLLHRLLIAHVPGEPDAILGWAAYERGAIPCVHYLYVRKDARRQGVARQLVGDVTHAEYSHAAPKGVVVPGGWSLNLARAKT